ncbi:hypothetical protein TELCIR_17902 [Teladorsagia circumcincta]|uniref:Uncharacterized protein n=1 Tax=Teladorsagia circumcincta TaxID=45464 RepID=A0A2G9TRT2_TELCI|nr:hypothetical protein TELCIR_17902 [Teladorsagia circumcincta]
MARTSGGPFRYNLQERSEGWSGGRSRCSICGRGRQMSLNKEDTKRRLTMEVDEEREVGWATEDREPLRRRSDSRDRAETRRRRSLSQEAPRMTRQVSDTALDSPDADHNENPNLFEDEYCEGGLRKSSVIVYRDSRGRFARGPRN